MDPNGPDFVHTVQECAKLAFADREVFYGDPKFTEVPMGELLGKDYNAARRQHVGEQASMEMRPGHIEGFGGSLKLRAAGSTNMAHGHMSVVGESESTKTRSWTRYMAEKHGDTCHFDIIDRWGNMVSVTPSGGYGAGTGSAATDLAGPRRECRHTPPSGFGRRPGFGFPWSSFPHVF